MENKEQRTENKEQRTENKSQRTENVTMLTYCYFTKNLPTYLAANILAPFPDPGIFPLRAATEVVKVSKLNTNKVSSLIM